MRHVIVAAFLIVCGGLVVSPVAAQDATPAVISGQCATPSREEAADVATRYINIWNTKDVDQFDEVASPEIVHHWGMGEDTVGIDALKSSTEAFFLAFPDLVTTIDDVIVEGNMVVIRWTNNGTHTGPLFEIEPSGYAATWTGINIYRVSCGKVVESWSEADGVGLRSQLDPATEPATPTS